jgi:hypothetical protein
MDVIAFDGIVQDIENGAVHWAGGGVEADSGVNGEHWGVTGERDRASEIVR